MSPIETNEIIFEVVKGVILGIGGWLLKMHSEVRSLRSDLNHAFSKIRELQCSKNDPKA